MDERATGVVLRRRSLTESSLIVHWLASPWGRIATVAKGARRPRSPFRGKLDLFYLASFSFHRSRRSDLHTLREVTLQESFPALRTDLARLRQAAYAAALIEKMTEPETSLDSVYDLFTAFLRHLTGGSVQPLTLLAFECKLLADLGWGPQTSAPALSAGAGAFLRQAAALPWENLNHLKPSSAQLQEMQGFLKGFLLQNLGVLPAGRHQALGWSEP
jgi:DNA repair protein RecO